jgi:hypothetical protein
MSQSNPEAREVEEGAVSSKQMLMTNQQPAELTEPSVCALHYPAAQVPPRFASIFMPPLVVATTATRSPFFGERWGDLGQQ